MRPSSPTTDLSPEEQASQEQIIEMLMTAYLETAPITEEQLEALYQLLIDPRASVDVNLISLQHNLLEGHPSLHEHIKKRIFQAAVEYYTDSKANLSDFSTSWKPTKILAWGHHIKTQSLHYLKLKCNALYKLSPEQWTAFFLGVKESGLPTLDLTNNELNNLTLEQWNALTQGRYPSLKIRLLINRISVNF